VTGAELSRALQCGRPSCKCSHSALRHCPVTSGHSHGDSDPSLSFTASGDKTLMKCHAGCSQDDVIAELRQRGWWGSSAEPTPTPIRSGRGSLVTSYEFRDAAGELVAEHGRFESEQGKSFAWRVPGKDWRDGLGSIGVHDLPLYGLRGVLEDAGAPVWVVEGEKAADAARAAGLVAVCLGGGAAQKTFGNTLDPLRGRDVILWPDNDEAGAAFMGRLAGLLPQARYVRPVVPQKGDAWDYFNAGGTVAGLHELLSEPGATVTIPDRDAITISLPVPAGDVRFEFTNMVQSVRSLEAEMRVMVLVPGKRPTPYSTRVNLQSSSAREGIRREIEGIYGKTDLGWPALLAEACDLAKETWRGLDYSVDLSAVALPEERRWAVEHFAPEGLVTIVFGMGGSGKSLVCADMALHCLYGMDWKGKRTRQTPGVLVIDYEDAEDEWRLRVQQLCDGYGWQFPEQGYRYMPGRAVPVADQIVQIRRLVAEHHIGLVVVDSAASACGGDLLDTTAAARLINALTDLGTTSIIIAHNTKAEDSKYPYGNIFWHNLVRATHYIESEQAEGSSVMDSVLYNRKANRGLQKPLSIHINFSPEDTGPVTIDLLARMPEKLRKPSMKGDLEAMLRDGEYDATSLAEATGYTRARVAEMLRTDQTFAFARRDGKRTIYKLAENVSIQSSM